MNTPNLIRTDLYPSRKESSSFPKRLEFLVKIAANNDVALFAERSDISTSALRSYLRGDSDPSMSKLTQMVLCSGIQLEWLVLGSGPVYCETTMIPIITLKEAADSIQNGVELNPYSRERRNMIDNIQIRPDVLNEQFGLKPEDILVAQHEGYTMAGTLSQGDWVLLDKVNTTPVHGLYLVAFTEGYDVRRLIRHPNDAITISCDNERYPSFTIGKEEFESGTITVLAQIRHSWNAREM